MSKTIEKKQKKEENSTLKSTRGNKRYDGVHLGTKKKNEAEQWIIHTLNGKDRKRQRN